MSQNEPRPREQDVEQIQQSWEVVDANGEKVGDVEVVNPHYLTVAKGFFVPSERYIPCPPSPVPGREANRAGSRACDDE